MAYGRYLPVTSKAVVVACAISVMAQPASAKMADGAADINILPRGMESRLLGASESRVQWHAVNEGKHLLAAGGVILGSYALNKAMETVAPQIPLGALLATSGLVLDYTLSPNWKDFVLRQALRLPYSFYRHYFEYENLHTWLSPILMEVPTLASGAWEFGLQMQSKLPEGSQRVHTEAHTSSYDLFFHNTQMPFFSMELKDTESFSCADTHAESHGFVGKLEQIACAAHGKGLRTLMLIPHSANGVHTLEVCQSNRALSQGAPVYSQDQCFTIQSSGDDSTQWLTSILSRPVNKYATDSVLSPFSNCVLSTIRDHIQGNQDGVENAICDDASMPTIHGAYMQLASLNTNGYLLADHTDTQSLSLPELWLVESSQAPVETLKAELVALEEKRAPGPEYGAWRLLSSARAFAYHTALNRFFEWATGDGESAQNETRGKGTEKTGAFNVKDAQANDLKRLTCPELEAEIEKINRIEGKVFVVTGDKGKSNLINQLAGRTVVDENNNTLPSGSLIQTARLDNGNYLVELQVPHRTNTQDKRTLHRLSKLQQAWMKKSDYVLMNEDMQTRLTHELKSMHKWIVRTLDESGSDRDKLKLVFNKDGQNEAATNRFAASLKEGLKDRQMYVMDMGSIGEGTPPQWLKDIQKSVLTEK